MSSKQIDVLNTFSFSSSSRFSFSQLSPNRLTSLRSLSLFSVATSNCCLSSLFTSTRVLFLSCCSSNRTFHCWSSPRWRSCKAIKCIQKCIRKFQKLMFIFFQQACSSTSPTFEPSWSLCHCLSCSLTIFTDFNMVLIKRLSHFEWKFCNVSDIYL